MSAFTHQNIEILDWNWPQFQFNKKCYLPRMLTISMKMVLLFASSESDWFVTLNDWQWSVSWISLMIYLFQLKVLFDIIMNTNCDRLFSFTLTSSNRLFMILFLFMLCVCMWLYIAHHFVCINAFWFVQNIHFHFIRFDINL